jgi:hypothetical protein
MPSASYYQRQAKTLLIWATTTKDKVYAGQLCAQAAKELEQAERAREVISDLNSLLAEFNIQQLIKG